MAQPDKKEREERHHLAEVQKKLNVAVATTNVSLSEHATIIREQKAYLWGHRADMDHVEKISTRQSVEQRVLAGENVLVRKQKLLKLLRSPYFGRFDFIRKGQSSPLVAYVGIHNFFDEEQKKNLIYDWRAPIATMFYDFEPGPARYESPSGDIAGRITLKRQFRIRQGRMEFMLESGLNILDDVLQEELSRTSDDRMKNIVATIQRDQNTIIRNDDAHELIIQGVAGSGKTSIALHRIAFLLYRHKDTLSSRDILIISPNRVFADYIANVLPELGEENIAETQMETLANELLEGQYRFETFFDQANRLLEHNDEHLKNRIREKSSLDFLKNLGDYAAHIEQTSFQPQDVVVGGFPIAAGYIENSFKKHHALPATTRLTRVAADIVHTLWLHHGYELLAKERKELKTSLKKMLKRSTLRTVYKDFFTWLGKPELIKPAKRGVLEYADVFPLIYLKITLEGPGETQPRVKHLLIDEMQDHSPVQYAIIARIFTCRKTILGDATQSISPYGSSTAEQLSRVFRRAECVNLYKSYRSTWEIMQFAQRICPNPDLVAIERHGEVPQVLGCNNDKQQLARIMKAIEEFFASGRHTLGILCKTPQQAEQFHATLQTSQITAALLTPQSTAFARGVVVCSLFLAKGLEFDQVIVPDASDDNYATEMDRNLLYVACTRAMHRLILTYIGNVSPFISHRRQ